MTATTNGSPISTQRSGMGRRSANSRRGVSVILVLTLVSMTLALAYAMMRSQGTAVHIRNNADRRALARHAATTGLTLAWKKMHTAVWAGVDTSLAGAVGANEGYTVTYTAGDPALSPDDADYPYRVTLESSGYSIDPADPTRVSTHRVRAVVRLVPRETPAEPADWSNMQKRTVYQTGSEPFEIDIPCRISGSVRVQGKLKIARHYPDDYSAWAQYLTDLNKMRVASREDFRPLGGPVFVPAYLQDAIDIQALVSYLGVSGYDIPVRATAADWVKPGAPTTYSIYDGGPVYNVPTVDTSLQDTTLQPDPRTNPLGIFYRNGTVSIRDNVTVRGTLFCKDDVKIEGTNVHIEPVDLPNVDDSGLPFRLPAVVCRNFLVTSAGGGSLRGLAAVFDRFEVQKSSETVEFAVSGRLITQALYVKERQPWETLSWKNEYDAFEEVEEDLEDGATLYFPEWLRHDPKPRITIAPESTSARYHWYIPDDPVYLPHPGDDGFCWDMIRWTDDPSD